MRRMNNYAFGSKGVVALEEEQTRIDNASGTDEATVLVEDNAGSAETDLIEIIEENNAADLLIEQIGEGQEAMVAVESFITSLRAAKDAGGLDKNAAAIVGTAMSFVYAKAGFADARSTKAFPALESFGGQGTRVKATQIALEEAESRFKKIWQSILEAIKKAIAWIKDKFMAIFGAAEKLQKRARTLYQRASDNTSATKGNETIENERLAGMLSVGGSVPDTAAGLTKNVIDSATVVFTKLSTTEDSNAEAMIKFLGELKDVADIQVPAFQFTGFPKVADPVKEGLQKPVDGIELFRSPELPGGKAVFARLNTKALSGEAAASAIRAIGGSVDKYSSAVKAPADAKLKTLALGEIANIGKAVDELMGQVIARRSEAERLNKISDNLLRAAEKASNDAEKDDPKIARVKSDIAVGLVRGLGHPAEDFTRYVVGEFGKAVLDYAELSMKEYGGKAAKTDDKPAEDKPAKK